MADHTYTSPVFHFLVEQDAPLPISSYRFVYDREKFYVWIRAGLKAQRIGRHWTVRPSDFCEWIERITTEKKLSLEQILAKERNSKGS